MVALARDATALLHEAQYYPEEKKEPKPSWGLIAWEEAALLAKETDVKSLYLSHHDPSRSDFKVYDILSRARRIFVETEVATENTILDFRNEIV